MTVGRLPRCDAQNGYLYCPLVADPTSSGPPPPSPPSCCAGCFRTTFSGLTQAGVADQICMTQTVAAQSRSLKTIVGSDRVQGRVRQMCATTKALLAAVDMLPLDVWWSVAWGTLLATVRDGDCIVDVDVDVEVQKGGLRAFTQALQTLIADHGWPLRVLMGGEKHTPPLLPNGKPNPDPWYSGRRAKRDCRMRILMTGADGSECAQPHIDVFIAPKGTSKRSRCRMGNQPAWCIDDFASRLPRLYGADWRVPKPRQVDVNLYNRAPDAWFQNCMWGGGGRNVTTR